MKKVALISSFCDNTQKEEVLKKNIKIIRDLGIDIVLISPFPLPTEIENSVDYFIKTKDNPVLDWPVRSMFSWSEIVIKGEPYIISRTYADYGWAGLFQVKQLSEISLLFDYDQFFHLIYDLNIDENVVRGFNSDKICNIYPSKRGKDVWKVGLHFMIFDRKNLERFISHIHLDSYLSLQGADAFVWLHNLHSVFPYNFESEPVEDEIYYYEGHDFYNYSPLEDFRMFVVKNDETKETLKLMFYNVKNPSRCKLHVNNIPLEFFMTDYKVVDLEILDFEVQNIEIFYEDKIYNVTKTILGIKHNTLRKK